MEKDELVQETKCPGCGKEFFLNLRAVFKPEVVTVVYTLEKGRKMAVRELCRSMDGLAKALQLTAENLGTKVEVQIENITVNENEVSATVSVVEVRTSKREK